VAGKQPRRQVPVDAGHLQGAPTDGVTEQVDGRIAQAAEIAPEDEVDQPLALEDLHRVGVEIGPPVVTRQVSGDGGLQVSRTPRWICVQKTDLLFAGVRAPECGTTAHPGDRVASPTLTVLVPRMLRHSAPHARPESARSRPGFIQVSVPFFF